MKLMLDKVGMGLDFDQQVNAAILGFALGDAIGVPVEFNDRKSLEKNPVEDLRSGGTHGQPKGTWSDDSSETFVLMESLLDGYDLKRIAKNMVRWADEGFWTPHGTAFDIGKTTELAIDLMRAGKSPEECGQKGEGSNGNGSLMRTLPLVFYTMELDDLARTRMIYAVSSLTHAHPRSLMACRWYTEFGIYLVRGKSFKQAFEQANRYFLNRFRGTPGFDGELDHFARILDGSVLDLNPDEIISSGYVIPTLESVIWSLANSSSWKESVLKAVNLGDDTDTIGALTGGLAGLMFGLDSIPQDWIDSLVRLDDIRALNRRFTKLVKTVKT